MGQIAKINEIEIWWEDYGDKSNPSVLLIMGANANCMQWPQALIDKLVEDTMPSFVGPKILPIENDDILWLQQFTGVHKGRMCTIMGGRRNKKTRKMRGGLTTIADKHNLYFTNN